MVWFCRTKENFRQTSLKHWQIQVVVKVKHEIVGTWITKVLRTQVQLDKSKQCWLVWYKKLVTD
jgi:hypothetical protein